MKQKLSTSDVMPGMIVAEDLYTTNNQLIAAKNSVLTERIISRLKFYMIEEVSVIHITEKHRAPVASENPTPGTYSALIKNSPEFKKFEHEFFATVPNVKRVLNDVVLHPDNVPTDTLLQDTNAVLTQARNNFHLFAMLHSMRNYDDLTYIHSLNVALISNIIGHWLRMSQTDIDQLTLAGLLHDIGKLTIPQEIITKPKKLTSREYRIVKNHCQNGYDILFSQNLDSRIRLTALMHHERCDGSGYPNEFTSGSIEPFAKIVAIADVYDAMSSRRVYRDAICPFEIIDMFEMEGLQKYDPQYMLVFLEGIVQTYLSSRVHLNNGSTGTIVMLNKHRLAKPVIQCGDGFVDLSKENDLFITELIV